MRMKPGWALGALLNRDAFYVSMAVSGKCYLFAVVPELRIDLGPLGMAASITVATYKSGTGSLFIFP